MSTWAVAHNPSVDGSVPAIALRRLGAGWHSRRRDDFRDGERDRMRRHTTVGAEMLAGSRSSIVRQPGLFAHWRFGTRPDGWTMGAR